MLMLDAEARGDKLCCSTSTTLIVASRRFCLTFHSFPFFHPPARFFAFSRALSSLSRIMIIFVPVFLLRLRSVGGCFAACNYPSYGTWLAYSYVTFLAAAVRSSKSNYNIITSWKSRTLPV